MADYYPLIARAIAGLDKNTGEIRRELYERARVALVGQLRSVDPPLNESDVTRERLALEEAIRKVETEASKRKPETADENRPSLSDEGLRGFRAVVAEAESLGEATAEANRAAHEAYEAVPSDQPPPDAQPAAPAEPHVEDHAPDHVASQAHDLAHDHLPEHAHDQTQDHTQDRVADHGPDHPPVEELAVPLEPAAPAVAHDFHEPAHEPPPILTPRMQPAGDLARHPTPIPLHLQDGLPADDDEPDYARPPRSYGGLVKILVLLLIVGIVGGVAYWQRGPLTQLVAGLTRKSPPQGQQQAAQPSGRPKITDRVGGGNAPGTANAPAAGVAQKVVLYDEDSNDPQGKRYVGSALWRTETVSPGPGLAPEIAVRADVEIPERHMRMTWSLRRNTDKALPASHTIEIMFTLPADFSEGGVNNIPGVLMKQDEQARGVPLAGLAVKVTNGYFLIGLSAVEVDMQRNIDMLKNRDWFDIPIVYTSGKRAILALEKGTAGARVFEEAFRAWGQ